MSEPASTNTAKRRFPKFLSPFGDLKCQPCTLIELKMMITVLEVIKSKPYWYEKVQNKSIRDKWMDEINSQDILSDNSQLKYIFDELLYYSSISSRLLSPASVDCVWMSDHIIDGALHQRLADLVAPLEATCTDFHPGSNDQVLDLVHPHMYPYVSGLSRVVDDDTLPWNRFIGAGEAQWEEDEGVDYLHWYDEQEDTMSSTTYQWLPSEVQVNEEGKCKFISYINNLHPRKHAELYNVLELILERFLPLFNQVLTNLAHLRSRRHKPDLNIDKYDDFWESPDLYYYDDEEEEEEEEGDTQYKNDKVLKPEFTVVKPFKPHAPRSHIDLKGSRLQVIVKLASIILTPEKPTYDGGNWHIEGMKNENIIASGIYYWYSENITESKLSFRTSVDCPENHKGVFDELLAVFGLSVDEPLIQDVGAVTCIQGRCLCWPNILQHKVEGFQLEDPTLPGIRKVLVFFLVDPNACIKSTALVPPQQQSWMEMELDRIHIFSRLPLEVRELIMQYTWHFTHDMALEVREDVMDERKYFVDSNTQKPVLREYDLCEH